jgi:hypothetical protein
MKTFAIMMAAVLVLAGSAMAATYIEPFTGSNAGWEAARINDGGGVTYTAAAYSSPGGNPGGYISGTVDTSANRLYGLQCTYNTTPYGDMTGLQLTVDYKIDGTVTGPVGAMVRFYIGTYSTGNNYYVSNDAFSWNPNIDTAWTTHQIPLVQSDWLLWPNQNTGSKTFAQIVAAPEDMGLVFADSVASFGNNATLGFSGTATISIDNFGTVVPEPATMAFLALGGIGMLVRRRRK